MHTMGVFVEKKQGANLVWLGFFYVVESRSVRIATKKDFDTQEIQRKET